MEKYGFFDAIVTGGVPDRAYSANDVNSIFKGMISDGVFRRYGGALRVSSNSGFGVVVETGRAIVHDHWYVNSANKALEFESAHPTLSKICSVVLRYSRAERSIHLATLEGTPEVSARVPELTQNDDIFELRLANIYISAGATAITRIVDTREYASGLIDTPAVNYRRYSLTVESVSQQIFNIPDQYQLTFDSTVEVYADGNLCPSTDYSIQKSGSTMQISFYSSKAKPANTHMDFIMIN